MVGFHLSPNQKKTWGIHVAFAAQIVDCKWLGGGGRNRTESSPTASLNTLIYKGILAAVLQGFKHFMRLSATYRT
jgi:hypothetical protein